MDNQTLLFPAGGQVLGRVLNSAGEPLDAKGALTSSPHVPLYDLNTPASEPTELNRFFESGIKVLDLFAPLAHGSVVALIANFGVGSMVLVEELLYNVIHRQNGCAVCVGLEENDYTSGELFQMLKELDVHDQVALLVEPTSAFHDLRLQLLSATFTVAQELRKQGREVILVLNRQLASQINVFDLPYLYNFSHTHQVTTCLFSPANEEFRRQEQRIRTLVDSSLFFNAELASQRIYPAIDPLLSNSRLLQSPLVSQQHRQVASSARELLREGQLLRINPSLTPEQTLQLARARKLQLFFSQPFFVAELFTEVPGEFIPLPETLKDVQALIDGHYDDQTEQTFAFIGAIARTQSK
jgi:F-type H+-transporting ATPase subunit beta